jgi:hypothetical protein
MRVFKVGGPKLNFPDSGCLLRQIHSLVPIDVAHMWGAVGILCGKSS